MDTFVGVVPTLLLDDDFGFLQLIEDLTFEKFVSEMGIKAFDMLVLPGGSWLDVGGSGTNGTDPFSLLQQQTVGRCPTLLRSEVTLTTCFSTIVKVNHNSDMVQALRKIGRASRLI